MTRIIFDESTREQDYPLLGEVLESPFTLVDSAESKSAALPSLYLARPSEENLETCTWRAWEVYPNPSQHDSQGWESWENNSYAACNPDELAYQALLQASEYDFAEAHYKLGDLAGAGRGTPAGIALPEFAFNCYLRAWDLSRFDDAVISGSCAFRLATSFEEGNGCAQSFTQALQFYQKAETDLEAAVNGGAGYYNKVLKRAQEGSARMKQELSGEY